MAPYILAIDHGTSGLKTAIMTTHGGLVDFEYAKTPIRFLPEGGAEQDPEDWWQALVKTAKALTGRGSVPRARSRPYAFPAPSPPQWPWTGRGVT